jgi:hypothetical protein
MARLAVLDDELYDVGDSAEIYFTTKNKQTQSFENPTNVTLTVKPPGIPAVAYAWPSGTVIQNPSAGRFTAVVPLTLKGWWTYFWEPTGALTAAEAGELYVRSQPV